MPIAFGEVTETPNLRGDSLKSDKFRPCITNPDFTRLALAEVIDAVVCNDPQQAYSIASVGRSDADIGVALSAYYPQISVSDRYSARNSKTEYKAYKRSLNGNIKNHDQSVSVDWLIFDQGERSARLDAYKHIYEAAKLNQISDFNNALITAANLYYDALSAQYKLRSLSQVSKLLSESYEGAAEKYRSGTVPLSDVLQYQVASTQASLNAEQQISVFKKAKGILALRMGFPASTDIKFPELKNIPAEAKFSSSIDQLLQSAELSSPKILAAKAEYDASISRIGEANSYNRAKVYLTGTLDQANTYQSVSMDGDKRFTDRAIAIQVNIPIFDGFERKHRVARATRESDMQSAKLLETRRGVYEDLWSDYQDVLKCAETSRHVNKLVRESFQSVTLARGRYESGVGTLLEVLNSTSSYTRAVDYEIENIIGWHVSRLRLALDLGDINRENIN